MSLLSRLREKRTGNLATAIPATFATDGVKEARTVARIATVAVAKPKEEDAARCTGKNTGNDLPQMVEPFDREFWEERAAIREFDGGLSRDDAETVAWQEDDRRRCRHCLNLQSNGVCKVASPQGPVVANRGYRPVDILKRCEGYAPSATDTNRRPGRERWPGLIQKGNE